MLCVTLVDKLEMQLSEAEVKKRAVIALPDLQVTMGGAYALVVKPCTHLCLCQVSPMASAEFTNWFTELFIDFDPNFEDFKAW